MDNEEKNKATGLIPLGDVPTKAKDIEFHTEESGFIDWRKHAVKEVVDAMQDMILDKNIDAKDRIEAACVIGQLNKNISDDELISKFMERIGEDMSGGVLADAAGLFGNRKNNNGEWEPRSRRNKN